MQVHGFDPWSRILHVSGPLRPCTTATESVLQSLQLLSLHATIPEAHAPRARALQQEQLPP